MEVTTEGKKIIQLNAKDFKLKTSLQMSTGSLT